MARRETKSALKARFLNSLVGANMAKLKECELTLTVTIARAKAGGTFKCDLPELEELMAAVKAAMRRL